MTENMKFWLKKLYLNEANDHLETARFEHLCALGSPNDAAAMLHEMNADEHRAFAKELQYMANKIEEGN
jgi:predicted NAD/FAD-binding protein